MASGKKSSSISSYDKSMEDYRVESDLRALQEAEAIEKDPKRMKAAQELAKKKLVELAAVVTDKD